MWTGLTTTVVVTLVPYIDRVTSDSLARHIRAGYPTYAPARVDAAATTYLVYLTIIGLLGVAGWLWTIRAVGRSRRRARAVATALFVLGTTVAVTDLLITDTSGDTGLSPLLGWTGLLPSVAGLLAVTLLWSTARSGVPHPGTQGRPR